MRFYSIYIPREESEDLQAAGEEAITGSIFQARKPKHTGEIIKSRPKIKWEFILLS